MYAVRRWINVGTVAVVCAGAGLSIALPAHAVTLSPLPAGWVREPANGHTNVALAATSFEGKVYVFAKALDDTIWLQTYDPVTRRWLSTQSWSLVPGGGITDTSLAATATSDALYLFAKGKNDKQVYVNRKSAGGGPLDGWSGWFAERLPAGQTNVAVAAAATRDGTVSVFRTGPNGQIYLSQRSVGGYWQPWTPVAVTATNLPPAAAVDDDTGTLYVFGVGRETQRIFMNSRHLGSWRGSWPVVDGDVKTWTGVAGAASGGKLYLFHSGPYFGLLADGRIRAQQYSGEWGVWSGAAELPGRGKTNTAVAVARVGDRYMVFAKGIEVQGIYYSFFSGSEIVPEVNTRGHFDTYTGKLKSSHTAYDYRTIGTIPGLTPGTTPPAEIAIAVHGWQNEPTTAQVRFQRARASLRILGYQGPVVGFSWDSDTDFSDFDEGRVIAIANGRKLAKFIDDFKMRCPATKIHLMGHSLGTRVVLDTILALSRDGSYSWNRQLAGARIDDVHLLGAAVDNEEPQMNERYGQAILFEVGWLYNYYDPEDDVLEFGYSAEEGDNALGETGIEKPSMRPFNYTDVNVQSLLPYDGDAHYAYWGFRPEDIGDDAGTWPNYSPVLQETVGAMVRVRANFR